MKKYRLCYDFTIINEPFEHKEQLVLSMTIDVLYKVFNEKGEEVFSLMYVSYIEVYFNNVSL